jgi:hypothetical protein
VLIGILTFLADNHSSLRYFVAQICGRGLRPYFAHNFGHYVALAHSRFSLPDRHKKLLDKRS